MLVGCAVLMSGTSYAAPSDPAPQQSSEGSTKAVRGDHVTDTTWADGRTHGGKPSDEQRGNRDASDKNHPRSSTSLTKANRPNQLPTRREYSTSGSTMNLHGTGSDKSSDVAKGGLVQNETVNNALRVRPPSVARPAAPSLNNVRHRGPNPAVVGGSANSITRNTGALNGTHMSRKP
jgi:hypothetical protein